MITCDRTQSQEGVLENLHYCDSNPKSQHTPRMLFQRASRSESVLRFGIAIAFSGWLKVTVHPSRRTAFMPYRLFATNCAPRSMSDVFHALKASLDSVWSLKLCVFFKLVSPSPSSLATMVLPPRLSPNLRGSVGIDQCSLPKSLASSELNELRAPAGAKSSKIPLRPYPLVWNNGRGTGFRFGWRPKEFGFQEGGGGTGE
jgi:hypothetical protein